MIEGGCGSFLVLIAEGVTTVVLRNKSSLFSLGVGELVIEEKLLRVRLLLGPPTAAGSILKASCKLVWLELALSFCITIWDPPKKGKVETGETGGDGSNGLQPSLRGSSSSELLLAGSMGHAETFESSEAVAFVLLSFVVSVGFTVSTSEADAIFDDMAKIGFKQR